MSRDGALLAYSWKPYFGQGARIIASIAGAAASAPADRCALPGQETYSDPGSFAPDEIGFTYDDTSFDPNTLELTPGQGIFVFALNLNVADCGLSAAQLVVPGGAQPDWGPMAP